MRDLASAATNFQQKPYKLSLISSKLESICKIKVILESLGWETLEKRRLRNKVVLMYKILNDHSAPNLKQLFNKRNEVQTSYNLRNNQTDITLPSPKTEYLKRALGYNGAKLWNSFPTELYLYIWRWRSRISAEAKNMADQATYSHEVFTDHS